MELTEISGNIRLCFKDFTYGLPVSSFAEHTALLDSESEFSFDTIYPQYLKLFHTASDLQNIGKAFDLYFSVFGNMLSDPPNCEPQTLYYCHVQSWSGCMAVELYLPGKKKLIRKEQGSSDDSIVNKAINFAFGGFIFSCLDFSIKQVDLNIPYISEALELYCLVNDKQLLLDELFRAD